MYVRFLQVREIIKKHNFPQKNQQLNKITLFIGLNACLGCSLVANFQETSMLYVHWMGAIMLFVLGAVYQSFQVGFNRFLTNNSLFFSRLGFISKYCQFLEITN